MRSEPPDSLLVWADDAQAELENLRTYLELSTGFDLLVILSDSILMLDEVRKNVAASSGAIHELIYPNPAAMDRLVVDLLAVGARRPDGPALVWVEARGETHERRAAWAKGLAVFNQQRNLVAREVPHVVALVGANELAALIARYAPDLWSIRERVFRFPSPITQAVLDPADSRSTAFFDPAPTDLEDPKYYFDLADVFTGSNHPDECRARLSLLHRAVRSLVARRRFNEAETALRELLLPLSQSLDDPQSTSRVFEALADVLVRCGRAFEALIYSTEVLKIVTELAVAKQGQTDRQRDLSVSYDRLGDILRALDRREEAREYFEQSMDIRERLAKAEPDRADYQRDLSVSCNRLGDLLASIGRWEEALMYYKRSLDIRERLSKDGPDRADYQRDLAASCNRLGDLMTSIGRGREAFLYYKRTLDTRERLAKAEPDRADYQRDLSVSLMKLGDLRRAMRDVEVAGRLFEHSLEIANRLAEAEPNRVDYQRDLSVAYERLGDFMRELGRDEEAKRYFEHSLDIAERLVRAEPDRADFAVDLATSLRFMSTVDTANAPRLLLRALSIMRNLERAGQLPPADIPKIASLQLSLAALAP